MMVELSSLAYASRAHLDAAGMSLPLGHVQQLVAAALGHKSLAALQAADEIRCLPEAKHVVLDTDLLESRAEALSVAGEDVVAPLAAAFDEVLTAAVHTSTDSFVVSLQEFVDDRVTNDEEVAGQMAMTNGGLDEVYMPLWMEELPDMSGDKRVKAEIVGHVGMEQDPGEDRVYWGHHIDVTATLTVDRLGKRLFAGADLTVSHAKLRWFNEPPEEYEVGQ